MARSVVFATPGKLDLRSIMTFGLNSKPNTGHPIGFFGTGLKYAIAVLTRHNIPISLHIDGQLWTVSTEKSQFRDKEVTEVFLERHRKMLPPQVRKLPFTTELGKTWELWQAFRELYSNTLDEKGDTFVHEAAWDDHVQSYTPPKKRGMTYIVVESEDFVQEYFDREKTFLPEGLAAQESTEDIQVFDRPSKYVYYRGIRVLDLKEHEYSSLTYNILRRIELTEDRTAKSQWEVQYCLAVALAAHEDPEIIKKAVTSKAPLERGMNFTWGNPSSVFLQTVDSLPRKDISQDLVSWVNSFKPKEPVTVKSSWHEDLVEAIESDDFDTILKLVTAHKARLLSVLKKVKEPEEDDIPF